jgi:hypothetical protein
MVFSAAFCTLGISLMITDERSWEFWGTVVLLAFFLVVLLAAVTSKVENSGEFVTIVDNFKKTKIPKISIERVSREKGVGVYLKLNNGQFVKLPALGRNEQSVVNSVRSWLGQS